MVDLQVYHGRRHPFSARKEWKSPRPGSEFVSRQDDEAGLNRDLDVWRQEAKIFGSLPRPDGQPSRIRWRLRDGQQPDCGGDHSPRHVQLVKPYCAAMFASLPAI